MCNILAWQDPSPTVSTSSKRNELVTGLVRAPLEFDKQVMATSGKDGLQYCPVTWGDNLPEIQMEWIDIMPGENLKFVMKKEGEKNPALGLIRGFKQIGRRNPIDVGGLKTRIWLIERIPSGWDDRNI